MCDAVTEEQALRYRKLRQLAMRGQLEGVVAFSSADFCYETKLIDEALDEQMAVYFRSQPFVDSK